MVQKILLSLVRKWLPSVSAALRAFRRSRSAFTTAVETSYGFKIAGPAAMQRGDFEKEETAQILQLLRSTSVFVNVGANVGYYVLLARPLVKHVLAIEPLAENVELLKRNLSTNKFNDVEVFQIGCGSQVDLLKLYGGGTAASLIPGWAGADPEARELIPVNTLDNIMSGRFRDEQLLIVIDVEGFELQVLQGAVQQLSRKLAPFWLVEICLDEHQPHRGSINANMKGTFELFWTAGYTAERAGVEQGVVTIHNVIDWEQGKNLPRTHNFLFRKTLS